jgi:DNA-binding YbaB/EbfC family protein
MFDQMKKMMELQKKAKQIQGKLANTHIEADEGYVTVTINGKQEFISIAINPEAANNLKKLEHDLVKAGNKALKKSQEIAAHEMKDVMGDLGLGGMPGMQK